MDKNREYKLSVKREGQWEDPIIRSSDITYLCRTGDTWVKGGFCEEYKVDTVIDPFSIDVV